MKKIHIHKGTCTVQIPIVQRSTLPYSDDFAFQYRNSFQFTAIYNFIHIFYMYIKFIHNFIHIYVYMYNNPLKFSTLKVDTLFK